MRFQLILISILSASILGCNTSKSITSMDNSLTSLDWPGTYRTTLPCADCDGILRELEIKPDLTYQLTEQYLGKANEIFTSSDKFEWDKTGSFITLKVDGKPSASHQFRVGECHLLKLDLSGNLIESSLGEMYKLWKVGSFQTLTNSYWKLIEIYSQPVEKGEGSIKEAHIILSSAENKVSGNGSCNNFFGSYELSPDNKISFSSMASTKMACEKMAIEDVFFEVLEKTHTFELKGDSLLLFSEGTNTIAKFELVFFK